MLLVAENIDQFSTDLLIDELQMELLLPNQSWHSDLVRVKSSIFWSFMDYFSITFNLYLLSFLGQDSFSFSGS